MFSFEVGQFVEFQSELLEKSVKGNIYSLHNNGCVVELTEFDPVDSEKIHSLNHRIMVSYKALTLL